MNKEIENPRRNFIKKSALAATAINLSGMFWDTEAKAMAKVIEQSSDKPASEQKTVALIANIYRNSAHADVIATKLFAGIPTDDGMVAPQVKIVSVWIDQIGDNDTGVRIAGMNGAKMYDTIAGALTL